MECNDFFVLIYGFLNESYTKLKNGECNQLSLEDLDTKHDEYARTILAFLLEKDFIEYNEYSKKCWITGKGIEYLYENQTMQKVKEALELVS